MPAQEVPWQPGEGAQLIIGGIVLRSDKGKLFIVESIAQFEGLGDDAVLNIFNVLDTPEVNEAQAALKKAVEAELTKEGVRRVMEQGSDAPNPPAG